MIIEKILRVTQEGGTIDNIAEKLEMRKTTVRAILEFMVEKGYLVEIDCSSGCDGCLLKCRKSAPAGTNMKMYIATEKGMKHTESS